MVKVIAANETQQCEASLKQRERETTRRAERRRNIKRERMILPHTALLFILTVSSSSMRYREVSPFL